MAWVKNIPSNSLWRVNGTLVLFHSHTKLVVFEPIQLEPASAADQQQIATTPQGTKK